MADRLYKPFRKKSDQKNRKKNSKNQSEIDACEQKISSEKWKFSSNKSNTSRMNYEWIGKKPSRKKSDPKNRKKQ